MKNGAQRWTVRTVRRGLLWNMGLPRRVLLVRKRFPPGRMPQVTADRQLDCGCRKEILQRNQFFLRDKEGASECLCGRAPALGPLDACPPSLSP